LGTKSDNATFYQIEFTSNLGKNSGIKPDYSPGLIAIVQMTV
jgi:hypothetical protein